MRGLLYLVLIFSVVPAQSRFSETGTLLRSYPTQVNCQALTPEDVAAADCPAATPQFIQVADSRGGNWRCSSNVQCVRAYGAGSACIDISADNGCSMGCSAGQRWDPRLGCI